MSAAGHNEDEMLPAVSRAQSMVALGNLRGATSAELIKSASETATVLAQVINERGLYKKIGDRNYVFAEGWTTLATICGLMPCEVACENVGDGVYVAVVALVRINDGHELTRASAECGGEGDEMWQKRAAYARRSMATTRATGKVCRIALSWVMNLAGFAPTPAEEMEQAEREIASTPEPKKAQQRKAAPAAQPTATRTTADTAAPEWYSEPLGFGQHANRTWGEMGEGGLGGGRHRYCEWLTQQEATNPAQEETKRRAKVLLDQYQAREADGF